VSGLHISNLSHAFDGVDVVSGVSVFVAPGELVCLLGPSGCGKTTMLRVAAGLEEVQRGQVHIGERLVADGASGVNVPPEKRGIGLMFQDYALFPHLSVSENIMFGVADHGARSEWMAQSLEQMDLAAYGDSFPHTLSGGQQQRVALLRAMAPGPRVLLLDEPFSGLDVARRAHVREQALGLLKNTGVATLMVTHDPDEAMFMADRIVVMNEGRMVQDGAPIDIYFHPKNDFVAALFGPINRIPGRIRNGELETPLGSFPAPGLADGALAEVLVRPDGFRLAELGSAPSVHAGDPPCQPSPPVPVSETELPAASTHNHFEVVDARPLGRASFVIFKVASSVGNEVLVEARVPGVFLPEPGSRISVAINAREAFVFERAP